MKPMLRFAARCAGICVLFFAARVVAAPPIVHWQQGGAKVYFVQVHSLPVLDVSAEFPAGSAYDAAGFEGVSRLTHELLKEGSNRSSGAELDHRIASVGALLSQSFDRDRAGYRLRTLASAKERDQALGAFAEILQEPSFPADAFERGKASLLSSTREELTRPAPLAQRYLLAAMYPGHPYGRVRSVESVSAIAREQVIEFYRAQYRNANAVITLVGDISDTEAHAIAEQLTARLPPGYASAPLPAVRFAAVDATMHRVSLPIEQSHIVLGTPVLARADPDYFVLYLGNYVLGGGGFVSRLFRAVREERGLAYSVASYLAPSSVPGPFVVSLQTERSQTERALDTVRGVLQRFVAQGPSEPELRAAKKAIAGGFALRTDSNAKILDEVAAIGFYGLPLDWLDRFVAAIDKVSASQVRAAFQKRVDPARLSGVIVGAPQ